MTHSNGNWMNDDQKSAMRDQAVKESRPMRSQQEINSYKLELKTEIEDITAGRKESDIAPRDLAKLSWLKSTWETIHWCQGHPWTETYDLEYPQEE